MTISCRTLKKKARNKYVYQEHFGDMNYSLLDLATKGWCKEAKVKCNNCGKYFKVKVHITYYGSKLKDN